MIEGKNGELGSLKRFSELLVLTQSVSGATVEIEFRQWICGA